MTEVSEKIKTRGYWRFVVRPSTFDPERVAYNDLAPLLRRAAVSLRGWDFPHFDRDVLLHGQDHIGSETGWNRHLESWRFYQSGQFVFLGAMSLDWSDQSSERVHDEPRNHPRLGVIESLWKLTEVFELAARLSTTAAGSDALVAEVRAEGLLGRELFVDDRNRAPLYEDHRSTLDSYSAQYEMDREELLADVDSAARIAAQDLFARFGWNAPAEPLQSSQAQLRRL